MIPSVMLDLQVQAKLCLYGLKKEVDIFFCHELHARYGKFYSKFNCLEALPDIANEIHTIESKPVRVPSRHPLMLACLFYLIPPSFTKPSSNAMSVPIAFPHPSVSSYSVPQAKPRFGQT